MTSPPRQTNEAVPLLQDGLKIPLESHRKDAEMANSRLTGQESLEQTNQAEPAEQAEDAMVPDVRNGLTPSQMVDDKLQGLLGGMRPPEIPGRFSRSSSVVG
jgi:hypothetical protein